VKAGEGAAEVSGAVAIEVAVAADANDGKRLQLIRMGSYLFFSTRQIVSIKRY
jgi:hypothetical protein